MKKFRIKLLSVLLCAMLALTGIVGVGCGKKGGEAVDANKTQLYVGIYGGGYGEQWMKNLKARFEEEFADYELNGRTGVQVLYIANKERYHVPDLKDKILLDSQEIFMATGDDYDAFTELNAGTRKALDITDAVTTPLTEYGETRSIADKLFPAQVDHFNLNGKYYALPFFESAVGLTYNVEIFEENQLFIAKDGAPSEPGYVMYKWTGTGEKAAGPDGDYGTYDDGCPATLAEFYKLIDRIYQKGIDSLIWSLGAETYSSFITKAFAQDYHGLAESSILYDLGGANGRETTIVTGFNNVGTILEPEYVPVLDEHKLINGSNIQEAAKQAGYYYGLKMFEYILDSQTVSEKVWNNIDNIRVQDEFIHSNLKSSNRPVALMLEGTWWENEAEASGIFTRAASNHGNEYTRINNRFSVFPMPKIDESAIGEKPSMLGGASTFIVKSNIDPNKVDLAKKFIRFALTDESLVEYTKTNGLPLAYNYSVGDVDELEGVSHYTKSFLKYYQACDKGYAYESTAAKANNMLLKVQTALGNVTAAYQFGATYQRYGKFPTEHKYNGISAETYFNGLYDYVMYF